MCSIFDMIHRLHKMMPKAQFFGAGTETKEGRVLSHAQKPSL